MYSFQPCHTVTSGQKIASSISLRLDAYIRVQQSRSELDSVDATPIPVRPISKCVTKTWHQTKWKPVAPTYAIMGTQVFCRHIKNRLVRSNMPRK